VTKIWERSQIEIKIGGRGGEDSKAHLALLEAQQDLPLQDESARMGRLALEDLFDILKLDNGIILDLGKHKVW